MAFCDLPQPFDATPAAVDGVLLLHILDLRLIMSETVQEQNESRKNNEFSSRVDRVDVPPLDHNYDSRHDIRMGSFSVLPQDCLNNFLSFVSLRGCLNLALTSLRFMEEINGSELQRRQRRMNTSFAYSFDQGNNSNCKLIKATDRISKRASLQNIFLLPSGRDRIESLCHALPRSYPNRAMAILLLDGMNEVEQHETSHNDIHHEIDDQENNITTRFQVAFQIQKSLLRWHRYHAILLSDAIRANPDHWNGAPVQQTRENRLLTVPLEQYIGDVLCAYFLMGHSVAGLVEGGPAEHAWMDELLAEMQETNQSPAISYRAWIYLHSTLLRTAPFTWEQQSRLGIISPLSSHSSFLDVAQGSLLLPHHPFVHGRNSKNNHTKRIQLWDALRSLQSLRTTLNDFGRLGPTFRGRDLIQSQTVFPSSSIGVAREFMGMSPEEYSNITSFSPFLQSWASGEESVVAWLLFMHQEAGKARPLTVSPPLVTVKSSTNSE